MEKRNKVLFFITDNYPFGYGESFIENEISFLSQSFKLIYIISRNEIDKLTRKVPSNCRVYRTNTNVFKKKYKMKIIPILLEKYYFRDYIRNGLKKKIYKYQFYSKIIEEKIVEIINEEQLEKENIIVYSYWFYYGAYAAGILKKKSLVNKSIARAHGYDTFLERGIQLLKEETLENIDYLYPCSKNNEVYLKKEYGNRFNIVTSYLGTINKNNFKLKTNSFNIVSCSNLIPLKRVELIIEALAELSKNGKYNDIKWIHFGDGNEKEGLLKLAENKLKKIQYVFKGHLSNREVLEYYQNNDIKVFIHLSSSEGLPVSMMEVQSFGIPIIAADVGGVREIVNEKTGVLLSPNPEIKEIANAIEKILNLSEKEYQQYQVNSYKNWKENFNAENNYVKFINELLGAEQSRAEQSRAEQSRAEQSRAEQSRAKAA